ncbi:cytochrome P450 [Fennellomyces sp. T-0311]|nr:cytochrome P450 [Fennellomyces sp. T-0311]
MCLMYLYGTPKAAWPPSPSNLPFYWNGYSAFRKDSYRILTKWSKQLGDVFTVKLAQRRVIVLNDAGIVRKALVEHEQVNSSRLDRVDAIEAVMGDQGKTVFTAPFAAYWGRLRRGINKVLGDKEEVAKMDIPWWNAEWDGKMDPETLRAKVNAKAMEAVITMVMGKQSDLQAEWIETLMDVCEKTEQLQTGRWYYRYGAFIPLARTLGIVLGGQRAVVALRDRALTVLLEMDQGGIAESLNHIAASRNDPTPTQLAPDEKLINLLHLIMHGYRFLASTLFTLLQRLASLPDHVQERIADYPASFVAETLRYTPPVRLYSHTARADQDLEFNGKVYRVDENSTLIVNLDSLHFNQDYYVDPFQFDPERFVGRDNSPSILDKDVKDRVKDHLAFGVGRRACLGSRASQRAMVTVATQIVRKYKLRGGDPDTLVDHPSGIWSWTGRTDTKGAAIEFTSRV